MSALIQALADKVNAVRNLAERGLLSMIDVVRDKVNLPRKFIAGVAIAEAKERRSAKSIGTPSA